MKNKKWIIEVFIITFGLSVVFSYLTNAISINASTLLTILIIAFVLIFGIVFDMIGTAILTCKESAFHSMSSSKVKGAKTAIKLIKNNVKVASICNDIVGDVCGIISGGLGSVLAINAAHGNHVLLITIIVAAVISSLTVGGKAIFKQVAINKANKIVFAISKVLGVFLEK